MATSTPGGDGASDTKRGMATSTPGGTSDTKRSIATSTPGGDEGASETKRSRLAALHRKHAAAVAATTTPSPSKQPPPSSSSPASFRIFKTDPNDLNYAKLCPSVFNGPLVSQLQLRKDDSNVAVDKVLRELLGSNAKMSGKIGGTIETRVQDRVLLLDNPATQGGAVDRAKNKAHRSRSKRSSKHLSLRQHRHLGSFNLPIEYQKLESSIPKISRWFSFKRYELYLPMHEMWKEYARKLVHNCNDAMMQARLLTADLHGAMIAVVETKSTSYMGTNGIMVRETENTFGVMTIKDKLRVVPKAGTVFTLQLDTLRVTLFGNNLFLRGLHPSKRQQIKPTIEL